MNVRDGLSRIAEAEVAINQFRLGDRVSPPEYSQELWSKNLKCGTVYDEVRLKVIFIEGLQESILQMFHNYWGNNPEAYLQELARHTKSIASLRGYKPTAASSD